MNFKKWLDTHNLITYRRYLRDISGVSALLLIVFCVSLYMLSDYSSRKTVIHIIEKMKAKNQITLSAIKDYYTGDISNEFKRAEYITEIRTNVFTAIAAVNRFMPGVMGHDTPFSVLDILAIIMTESRFNPDAVSPKDAMGIMQIMHHKKYITPVDGVESPFDINCSVKAGLECLKRNYDMFGDERKAIIAYWGIVKRKDGTWVDKYYNKVMANKEIIQKVLDAEN